MTPKPKAPSSQIRPRPDAIIEQVYRGNQTAETVSEGIAALRQVLTQAGGKAKPARILLDLTNLGKTSAEARAAGARGIRTVPIARVAMYGTNLYNQVMVNLIFQASGKARRFRAFNTKAKAIAWLKKG